LVIAAGCATYHGSPVPDSDVARLTPDARAEVAQSHHAIDVAQGNIDTAKVQRDEAVQFRKVSGTELRAGLARQEAARSAVDLARSTRNDGQLALAQHDEDAANQLVVAARAKVEYADRLVQLRQARLDEAIADGDVARTDVNMRRAQLVEREGIAHPDMVPLRNDQDLAQQRLAERRGRTAALEGETEQLRTAWLQREHSVARLDHEPLAPPPARPMLPNPALQGDVNDTPAAPEMRQSQEPQAGTIAPNP
jgi:hypothetical protein